jgi:hypothetical protein
VETFAMTHYSRDNVKILSGAVTLYSKEDISCLSCAVTHFIKDDIKFISGRTVTHYTGSETNGRTTQGTYAIKNILYRRILISSRKKLLFKFKTCKFVHHHTIQINQITRCKNLSSLLLDVYVQLNMFRASSRPSSGAQQLQ